MRSPAKELIDEILIISNISLRKLAYETKVRESTLSRIKSGKTELGTIKTYMRILQYKTKMMKQIHLCKEGGNA